MSKRFRNLSVLVLTTALVPCLAVAQEVQFTYSQSELQRAGGAQEVYERMANEVEAACDRPGRLTVSQFREQRNCQAELEADIVSQINDNRVSSIHFGQTRLAQNANGE